MLDGRRYYADFPDEKQASALKLSSRELLDALAELERQFREQIEQFRRNSEAANGSTEPHQTVRPTVENE
jgi:hypothetical protein